VFNRLWLWLFVWLQRRPEWWLNNLNPRELSTDGRGGVNEDVVYWSEAAAPLQNKPYLRELAKMQAKLEGELDEALAMDYPVDKIVRRRLILGGFKASLSVLRDCHNNYIKLKREG
jgi:hypothetical protein